MLYSQPFAVLAQSLAECNVLVSSRGGFLFLRHSIYGTKQPIGGLPYMGMKMNALTDHESNEVRRVANPLKNPPKGFSINFLGAQYGGRLYLAEGDFICLYSVSILFLPLVPVAAFVVSASGNRIYGKISLSSLLRISGFRRFFRLYMNSFSEGLLLMTVGLLILGVILFFLVR
jgi:hypothetical protein